MNAAGMSGPVVPVACAAALARNSDLRVIAVAAGRPQAKMPSCSAKCGRVVSSGGAFPEGAFLVHEDTHVGVWVVEPSDAVSEGGSRR